MIPFLIFLLFLIPTVQYRFELGAFSFALMEPVALAVLALLLGRQLFVERRLVLLKNPLVLLFLGFMAWAVMTRPWSPNLTNGFSDLRDWGIPIAAFVLLVSTVREGWEKYAKLYLAVGGLHALLAIYQVWTDSSRFFLTSGTALAKRAFFATPDGILPLASYGVGLFNHPNGLGYFIALQLLIWLGLFLASKPKTKILLLPLGVILAAALYLSYAKTSILFFLLLAPLLLLARRWNFHLTLAAVPLLGLLLSLSAFIIGYSGATDFALPVEFDTVLWRFRLWKDAVELLVANPLILVVGNGDPALWDVRGLPFLHPHNLPLYFTLYYGLIGLGFLTAFTLLLSKIGLERASMLRISPLLAALFLGVSSLPVTGIIEALPNNVDMRMIFLNVCALFVGLLHEMLRKLGTE
ncbi:MAG: hypothetical protein M3220_08340 [Chloroflexota bacterium]|nr:hypothetical protein [Chloroflexota bacterium]